MHSTSMLTVGVSAMRTTAVASDRKAANKSSDSFVSCMVDFAYSQTGLTSRARIWHCSLSPFVNIMSQLLCVRCDQFQDHAAVTEF